MTTSYAAYPAARALAVQPDQGIGQTIRDAVQEATQEAVKEAAQAAQSQIRDAQQEVRDAQQELRDAQQQLRDARTPDQRGAANQAIFAAEQQIRDAEQALRRAEAGVRGNRQVYTIQPPADFQPKIPGEAVDIAIGFFVTCAVIVVGWPISRAFGRRLERRGAQPVLDAGVPERLERIEQAVDAIAIEVERISESQRFLTRIQERSSSSVE